MKCSCCSLSTQKSKFFKKIWSLLDTSRRWTKSGSYGDTFGRFERAECEGNFFLLGAECEKYPEIVKKIHADGHLIGVHSYEHVNLSNLTDQAAMEQVDKTDQIIFGLTGEHAQYIRPPYGCWKCNLDYETKMIESCGTLIRSTGRQIIPASLQSVSWIKCRKMISFCCMMPQNHR